MPRALPVLLVALFAGCKAAPQDPKQLTVDEEEFILQVDARLKEYDQSRKNGVPETQRDAEHALIRIADERREVIEKAAQCNDWRGRQVAILAIGFSQKDDVIQILLNALADPEAPVRYGALYGLAVKANEQTPIDGVTALVEDLDPEIRLGALFVLTKVLRRGNDRGTLTKITNHLDDTDWRVRGQAVLVLAVLQEESSVKPLSERALKDESAEVRLRAVAALRNIGTDDCAEPLIAALNDPEDHVADTAAAALGELTGNKIGRNPVAWNEWWAKRKLSGRPLRAQ